MPDRAKVSGALVGWKRQKSDSSVVIELQVAKSAQDFENRQFQLVALSLNDRQLRSFARDLVRASEAQGIELFSKKRTFFSRLLGQRSPQRPNAR